VKPFPRFEEQSRSPNGQTPATRRRGCRNGLSGERKGEQPPDPTAIELGTEPFGIRPLLALARELSLLGDLENKSMFKSKKRSEGLNFDFLHLSSTISRGLAASHLLVNNVVAVSLNEVNSLWPKMVGLMSATAALSWQ